MPHASCLMPHAHVEIDGPPLLLYSARFSPPGGISFHGSSASQRAQTRPVCRRGRQPYHEGAGEPALSLHDHSRAGRYRRDRVRTLFLSRQSRAAGTRRPRRGDSSHRFAAHPGRRSECAGEVQDRRRTQRAQRSDVPRRAKKILRHRRLRRRQSLSRVHTFEIVLVIAWSCSLATAILNLALVPRLSVRRTFLSGPREGQTGMSGPHVSVVIPARNEERRIEQTVRAMLAQTYADLEVIVVNDRSADRTAEILASIGDARLIVIHGEEPPSDWLGKPWACHQGCRAARGDLLLIVDADVHYSPAAITSMVDYIDAHFDLAMIAVLPRFELVGFWEHIA